MSHLFWVLVALFYLGFGMSQNGSKAIEVAFPYLLLVPDARSSGMGDVGVSTPSSVYSSFWNPAKTVFSNKTTGIGLSYYPYLQLLNNNVGVYNFSMFKTSKNKRSSIGGHLKYFSYGDVLLSSENNTSEGVIKPSEFSASFFYSVKLTNHFSSAVTLSYLVSRLKTNSYLDRSAVQSFSGGMSFYFVSNLPKNKLWGRWRAGVNISNIGPKISYTQGGKETFIPTNLKFGVSKKILLDEAYTVLIAMEFNKILVPSKPIYKKTDSDNDGILDTNVIVQGQSNDVDFLTGIVQSFYDAPGGFSEEISEYSMAIGSELSIKELFQLRIGRFYENPSKGIRNYYTIGAGMGIKDLKIDFSYLFSSLALSSPLQNTFKISIAYTFTQK